MRKGFASSTRLVVLAAGLFLALVGISARLVDLHWLRSAELTAFVDKARKQIIVDQARRGDILDIRGNRLATSRSLIEFGADPQVLRKEDEAKWPELAKLLGISKSQLEISLRRRFALEAVASSDNSVEERTPRPIRWVKLSEEVEESTYERILKLNIKGVYGNRHYRRVYPGGQLAAHILGYINKEGTPVTGVERHLDFYLRGQSGWRESERDGLRRELAQFRTREIPAADGFDVVLTLDTFVQHIVEEELEKIAKDFRPDSATIIVSDPRTGAILGIANYPTFDLNHYNKAPIAVQRNIAVTDMFEPGSTFKIVAASGVLEDRLVSTSTTFDCSLTSVVYEGKPRSLPRDSHANGVLSVAEIVGKSSNRGAAHLAMRLGSQRFYEYARAFGFGEETGFPFGGEIPGMLHPVRAWDGLTITRMPMGHAVGVTAMQMHYAMSTVANGGVLMRPLIVSEIRDRDARTIAQCQPMQVRRVISRETATTMARLLVNAASADGTGENGSIAGYEVAGKTGTTQKIINGRYSERQHVGSFVGFFPARRPQVAITVIVDNGRLPTGGTAYGGTVAAPSFKRIGEQLIPYLGILPAQANKSAIAMGDAKNDRISHP
jgi:cell division protein FtsI (penicillin-binding protein 3)/stage V sporulation protein D (sporulation-specific penicillin-binding protein)